MEWVTFKKEQSTGIYSAKNIRGKRIQWQPEHDKEGAGCAQVFAGHHNKHPSSPIPKCCCSRLVGTSTLHLLLSLKFQSFLGSTLLPPCLNFANCVWFRLEGWGLRKYILSLQDSICFELLTFPKKIINLLAWYVGFPMLFSTHTYCDKYLNTGSAYAGPPTTLPPPSEKKLIV
jgi:hypothetical protein